MSRKTIVNLDVWSPDGLIALGRHMEKYGIKAEIRANPNGMIRTPEPYFFAQWTSTDGIEIYL